MNHYGYGNVMQQIINTPVHPNNVPSIVHDLGTNLDDTFKRTIMANYARMSEPDLSVFIKNNLEEIAKDITGISDQPKNIPYIVLFKETKFIDAFTRAIASVPISNAVRNACNNLAYDYFTSDNPVPEIKQRFLNISQIVNRNINNQLLALGLDMNTACNLTMCRYSTNNMEANVKRLNFSLYFRNPDVMTEQMIVWIYEKLFDTIGDVFIATMLETYAPEEERQFGDQFMEVYGRVGNAVLDIVNNMTTDSITTILRRYYSTWLARNQPRVRFSLNCLSGDYARIRKVVEFFAENKMYIP